MKNICEIKHKDFQSLPVKVLQFGEGNFLRAFVDWYVEMANRKGVFNGRVLMVKPTNRGSVERLKKQNCFYTALCRGRENGKLIENADVISSVAECISCYDDCDKLFSCAESKELQVVVSNTTEAGIVYKAGERLSDLPNISFPAKLTAILYRRFKKLGFGNGLLILPVELIESNGKALKKCVMQYSEEWELGTDFIKYVECDCKFCSTLVDRIVTGFPNDEYEKIAEKLGYEDNLLVACEPYHSWIIEGKREWSDIFPVHLVDGSVIWTNDLSAYRERKVKILNGAHTMSVLAAYLCGFDIVRDMINDSLFLSYIKKGLFEEIIPTVKMPTDECVRFADSVLERFGNPFIDHRLLDISLNSVSKYKARCLCSVLDYIKLTGNLPDILLFGLAALIAFYKGEYDECGSFYGLRNCEKYLIKDSREVTDFFYNSHHSGDVVKKVISCKAFWDIDLTEISGLYEKVKGFYDSICRYGVKKAAELILYDE